MKRDRKLVRTIYESWNYLERLPEFKRLDPEDENAFVAVDMPFLEEIANKDRDAKRIADEDLRRVDILIYLIAVHAVIHQKNREQRKRVSDGRLVLVASIDDYNAVVDVFNNCVYSDQTVLGSTEQEALIKVVPNIARNGSMTIQDLTVTLDRQKRTVWGYVKSWKEADLISEQKSNGEARFSLGPVFRSKFADAIVDMNSPDKLINIAKDHFNLVRGFRAEPRPSSRVACNCALHKDDHAAAAS